MKHLVAKYRKILSQRLFLFVEIYGLRFLEKVDIFHWDSTKDINPANTNRINIGSVAIIMFYLVVFLLARDNI